MRIIFLIITLFINVQDSRLLVSTQLLYFLQVQFGFLHIVK